MASLKRLLLLALPCALTAGCRDVTTQTELNPAGPPMIRQVRLSEDFHSTSGSIIPRQTFAFGDHPDASEAEKGHVVTTGSPNGGAIRIVMDELLVGNYLERIACADGTYSDVPVGATPDDIAACAEAADVLPKTCVGEFAVCLGPNGPIGILDNEPRPVGDGAADTHQFIDDAVQIVCNDKKVPLNIAKSYWQPSGNQQKPAQGGLGVLGPAVILTPSLGLPTGAKCTIKFSEQVVDVDGVQVCAPVGGDITAQCTPGDTSAVSWTVDVLQNTVASPENNATGVGRTDALQFVFNASIDPATLAGITLKKGATNVAITPTLSGSTMNIVKVSGLNLDANSDYVFTFPVTFKDVLGGALPAPIVINFTTGA